MSPARNIKPLLLLACALGLLAAGSAWALKTDKNQPINVNADHGDFRSDPKNNSNGTGTYTGHVVIVQGSIVLTADKAVLHVVNNELDTADVNGSPATFVQQPDDGQPMHGEAQEITYDASKNEIVLITNAKLAQAVLQNIVKQNRADQSTPGERLMTADRIRYNTDTQRVIAKAGDDQQRVHISFPPKVLIPAQNNTPCTVTPAGSKPPSVAGSQAAAASTLNAPAPAAAHISARGAATPAPGAGTAPVVPCAPGVYVPASGSHAAPTKAARPAPPASTHAGTPP